MIALSGTSSERNARTSRMYVTTTSSASTSGKVPYTPFW